MSPEKLLANILSAWNATDGYTISSEMNEALLLAETEFDGVEATEMLAENMRLINEELGDPTKRITHRGDKVHG